VTDMEHQEINDEPNTRVDPAKVMVIMMFAGYALNFMDRQIVSVLIEPIKTELNISDAQIGLLTGFSFAMLYAVSCLPIAALADRYSRKKIIAACMALWSVTTALFGLASNYPQMFIARMLVGIGEGGFAPAAFSMVADYFPREKRATAIAIGAMGSQLGTMVGVSGGGYMVHWIGWRATMCIASVPGLIVGLLFLLIVKEPKRGASGGAAAVGPVEGSSVRVLLDNPVYFMDACTGCPPFLFAPTTWLAAMQVCSWVPYWAALAPLACFVAAM
jgi:predicted MFS family arabinose efflux permease